MSGEEVSDMRIKISRSGKQRRAAPRRITHVQFADDELAALARFLAAGRVLLQEDYPPVVGRLKAAMTRLGAETPKGF
jgi:hypothetical protein